MRRPFLYIFSRLIGLLLLFFLSDVLRAQDTKPNADTTFFLARKKGLWGKLGRALSVNGSPPVIANIGAVKNDSVFNPYKGKIIRRIHIEKLGFSSSVNDTSRHTKNFFNDMGDALHSITTDKVILRNLFFSTGDTLYPYLLADNERFLRELSYLQDARIIVNPMVNDSSAVEVIILCKDLFPIGGSMDVGSAKAASFDINDDNLLGSGDRIQVQQLFDADRYPGYGLGFEYLKRNIRGSFVNLALGYQNQAPSFNSGRREEKAIYIRGDLPLVSPYYVWTGAFEAAIHATQNAYLRDSLYRSDFKYNYNLLDGWAGYNIGARKLIPENFKTRQKRFIALRGIHRTFTDIPELYKSNYNISYSSLSSVLASFNIFEQDYYHTNFLYGFGRNEDVPEGFSLAFTAGWTNRNKVSRPYVGFDYQRNYFSDTKNYINYIVRFGTYFNQDHFEDISILTSLEYFTKLRKLGNSKWFSRHFMSGSITQQVKTVLNDPLRLTSIYGIPDIYTNTIRAATRVSANCESVFYNTWKFFGFSFAPFTFTSISYLKPISAGFDKGDIYTSIGGGVRTRNENLVFGTLELKAYYYPRITGSMTPWNITFNTDLRFKYISQFIKRPDFAAVN